MYRTYTTLSDLIEREIAPAFTSDITVTPELLDALTAAGIIERGPHGFTCWTDDDKATAMFWHVVYELEEAPATARDRRLPDAGTGEYACGAKPADGPASASGCMMVEGHPGEHVSPLAGGLWPFPQAPAL